MLSSGLLANVVKHETFHAIGLDDTTWRLNGNMVAGSSRYTGHYGLTVYRSEFNRPDAQFIPTDNGHWSSDSMPGELMTPFVGLNSYISQTTVYSAMDGGYKVVSEPMSLIFFILTIILVFAARSTERKNDPQKLDINPQTSETDRRF